MGLFARWFGGREKKQQESIQPVEYKGMLIYQESIAENGQYRVAGRITQEINGELQTHRFIRSDILSNKQEADQLMLKKAQLLIDQMSGQIFN